MFWGEKYPIRKRPRNMVDIHTGEANKDQMIRQTNIDKYKVRTQSVLNII